MLRVLLVCALANVSVASAAGLGGLTLHSSLGQMLDAEIELVSVEADHIDTLQAYMASNSVFEQMNIIPASVLRDIRFAIEPHSDKGHVLKVTSVKPIREPFVNLVVELSWASGTYLREYTFLLDPVTNHQQDVTLEPSATTPLLIAEQDEVTDQDQIESEEYIIVVNRGDSLLDIARSVKPDNLSVEQVAMAIYDRNPRAFYGSVHQLNRGAELIIPVPSDMQARTAAVARRAMIIKPKVAKAPANSKPKPAAAHASNTEPNAGEGAETLVSSAPVDTLLVDSAEQQTPSTTSSVAVVAQSMGVQKADRGLQSISSLRVLIQDLRTAMLGLGKELDVKTTQLDEISHRVNQLQEQQAATTTGFEVLSVDAVGSPTALKKLAEPVDSESVADIAAIPKDKPIVVRAPASIDSSSQAKNDDSVDATAQLSDVSSEESISEASESDIGPLSRLEVGQLRDGVQDARQSVPTNDTLALNVPTKTTHATEPVEEGWFAWFLDPKQNQLVGNRLRDAGLLALAMLLGYSLLRRLFGNVDAVELQTDIGAVVDPSVNTQDNTAAEINSPTGRSKGYEEVVNPLSAIEYFREQLTGEQRREHALKDTLKDQPDRQDVRLDLLKVYFDRGAVELFAITAREMYAMAKGKNLEWHSVIQMGLKLDPDMSFYNEPEDHGFTLSDEFAVSGINVKSVSAGRSLGNQPSSTKLVNEHGFVRTGIPSSQESNDSFFGSGAGSVEP